MASTFDKFIKSIRKFSWRKWVLIGFVFVLTLIFGTGLLTYWGLLGDLPGYYELKNIRTSNASEIVSEEGVILGKFYFENRTSVNLKNVSPFLTNGLVATEDTRFFQHNGFDSRSMLRVIFKSILMGNESSGGGSTITQQLAKNLFPRKRYWFGSILVNKWREIITAIRLEKVYKKQEILNLYLNTVPFSDNIFGIEVACRRFFDTTPKDIKAEEAAVLIGMLKGNHLYHPKLFPERAKERRNLVLSLMNNQKYLSNDEYDRLRKLPLKLKYTKENHDEGLATYYREHIKSEVEKLLEGITKPDGTPYNLYRDGLRIYTTISSRLQRYAEEAMKAHMTILQRNVEKSWGKKRPWETAKQLEDWMKNSERYKQMRDDGYSDREIKDAFNKKTHMSLFNWAGDRDTSMTPMDSIKYYALIMNVGFLAADPTNGAIRVWIGGSDFTYFKYDHVKARRQVGSTFKPIVYLSALQQGVKPCDYFQDTATSYSSYEEWKPSNSDEKYGGYYSLPGALAYSKNTISVQMLFKAGINNTVNTADQLGIKGKIPREPSIALGTADLSLWDMVTAFSTIAHHGNVPELHHIKRITTREGKVLVDLESKWKQPKASGINPEYCDAVAQMLRMAVDSGTAKNLRTQFGIIGQTAGKTGTTQDNTDGWFIGFKPNIVAGVWVGADQPIVKFKSMSQGQGSSSALPIWGRWMHKAQNDSGYRKWSRDTFATLQGDYANWLDCPLRLSQPPADTVKSGVGAVLDKALKFIGIK